LDDTDWQLADDSPVKILNILDDCSRVCVASAAMLVCSGENALATMAEAAEEHGWPERFWSDNARAFTKTLAAAVAALGVIASHTRPYSPNSNGKVERFHQTQKRWLELQPPADTLAELQQQLDRFRLIYNTQRPHQGINRRTPIDVWNNTPKTAPTTSTLGTTTTVFDTIVHGGRTYPGRYAITIGATHNLQRALTVITGTACHVFIAGRLVRQLPLDPPRRTQPLYTHRGPPTPTEREASRHA